MDLRKPHLSSPAAAEFRGQREDEILVDVAIYISSDPSCGGIGAIRQFDACRDLARKRGLNVVREIAENAPSQYLRMRPGYEELQAMTSDRRIGGVIVFDLERLYRSILDLESMIAAVDKSGNRFQVFSVQNGDIGLTTVAGRTQARSLVASATV